MLLAAAQGPGNYRRYMGDKDALNLPLDLFNRFACLLSCVPTPPPPKWPALHSPILLQRHSELVFGTLSPCAPKHVLWHGNACFGSKWAVLCNLCALALGLALHIFATLLWSCFIGSCHVWRHVWNVLNVVSALQFIDFRPTSRSSRATLCLIGQIN